jgi:hypothetical protein
MPIPQPLLQGARRDLMISSLWEGSSIDPTTPTERQLLGVVLPPWQRPEVWTQEMKVRFIEGIFLGFGTGYYVVNGADWTDGPAGAVSMPMSGWLLDGQQRITAIRDFRAGAFAVFGDVRYPQMSEADQRKRFDRVAFPCIELAYTSDEECLKELYRRLNFGGLAHTEADLALLTEGGPQDHSSAIERPRSRG